MNEQDAFKREMTFLDNGILPEGHRFLSFIFGLFASSRDSCTTNRNWECFVSFGTLKEFHFKKIET